VVRMIPNVPAGATSPEVLRVRRLLNQLREDEYVIWQRLPLRSEPAPDFLVLREDNRALAIKVSPATRSQVLKAKQPDLFADESAAATTLAALFGDEQQALSHFLMELSKNGHDGDSDVSQLIPTVIAFPNLRSKDIRSDIQSYIEDSTAWMAREHLTPRRFEGWIREQLGPALPAGAAGALRRSFTPEAVIPADFTVRQPIERNIKAQLTDYLFDYDQEWAMKVDYRLPEDVDMEGADHRLRLINGVAGSGKSLLIIYRAHLLKQLSPESNLLILSHNKPLIHDLQHRFRRLSGTTEPVPWISTFFGWCYHHWPKDSEGWIKPLGKKRREAIARQVWHEFLADTQLSEQQLLDEIDWFKDRLFTSREGYLQADRRGRGFGADEKRRNLLFDAMVAYNNELQHIGRPDWADIPRRMWRFIEEGRIETDKYDVILVDEAQFFAPIWFEIIKRLIKPGTGQLYLVADPTQGFLKRGQSWKASGLDVRGKSMVLDKSYRTTEEILTFASLFYRMRLPDDQADIVTPDFMDMPNGVVPEIVPLTAQQDEITRVINEIERLVDMGVPLQHILVIHANWQGRNQVIERLNRIIGSGAAIDATQVTRGDQIRVSTLNASTGLESPIVFLAGSHELYEQEQSLRISDDERVELTRDNTRKLYMAITRAGQRLIITYVGDIPSELKQPAKSVAEIQDIPSSKSSHVTSGNSTIGWG